MARRRKTGLREIAHRPVRMCPACGVRWPCKVEREVRLDKNAADEAVRASIADAIAPYMPAALEKAERARNPETKEI